jgi:hypothetical protein
MRYGEGVSIASQRRWVRYVEFSARKLQRKYVPGKTEITRIQFWGMKIEDGGDKVEVGIGAYVNGPLPSSKMVSKIHVFEDKEVCNIYL